MNRSLQNLPIGVAVLYVLLVFAGSVGWVMNIVKIFSAPDLYWLVGRVIGVFIPIIGAFAGYI